MFTRAFTVLEAERRKNRFETTIESSIAKHSIALLFIYKHFIAIALSDEEDERTAPQQK